MKTEENDVSRDFQRFLGTTAIEVNVLIDFAKDTS